MGIIQSQHSVKKSIKLTQIEQHTHAGEKRGALMSRQEDRQVGSGPRRRRATEGRRPERRVVDTYGGAVQLRREENNNKIKTQ